MTDFDKKAARVATEHANDIQKEEALSAEGYGLIGGISVDDLASFFRQSEGGSEYINDAHKEETLDPDDYSLKDEAPPEEMPADLKISQLNETIRNLSIELRIARDNSPARMSHEQRLSLYDASNLVKELFDGIESAISQKSFEPLYEVKSKLREDCKDFIKKYSDIIKR